METKKEAQAPVKEPLLSSPASGAGQPVSGASPPASPAENPSQVTAAGGETASLKQEADVQKSPDSPEDSRKPPNRKERRAMNRAEKLNRLEKQVSNPAHFRQIATGYGRLDEFRCVRTVAQIPDKDGRYQCSWRFISIPHGFRYKTQPGKDSRTYALVARDHHQVQVSSLSSKIDVLKRQNEHLRTKLLSVMHELSAYQTVDFDLPPEIDIPSSAAERGGDSGDLMMLPSTETTPGGRGMPPHAGSLSPVATVQSTPAYRPGGPRSFSHYDAMRDRESQSAVSAAHSAQGTFYMTASGSEPPYSSSFHPPNPNPSQPSTAASATAPSALASGPMQAPHMHLGPGGLRHSSKNPPPGMPPGEEEWDLRRPSSEAWAYERAERGDRERAQALRQHLQAGGGPGPAPPTYVPPVAYPPPDAPPAAPTQHIQPREADLHHPLHSHPPHAAEFEGGAGAASSWHQFGDVGVAPSQQHQPPNVLTGGPSTIYQQQQTALQHGGAPTSAEDFGVAAQASASAPAAYSRGALESGTEGPEGLYKVLESHAPVEEKELSLYSGDVVEVTHKDPCGWCWGRVVTAASHGGVSGSPLQAHREREGQYGWFPFFIIQKMPFH